MAASNANSIRTEARPGSTIAAPTPTSGDVFVPPVQVWRELEFWLVLLLALGTYWARPTTLSIRGEESRWANVAREMIDTGDWIVPREQGEVFANRPPLANWAIACSMLAFGSGEALAVRFPALLATCLTALMVYACGRTFLGRFGALIAAVGYATMGQVLQIGRLAETEPLFTLFTSAALLGWMICYLRGYRAWVTWSVGYSLAALAALTKGPQGPIYFVASTWIYLYFYDRAYLRTRAHLVGLAVFGVIVAIWLLPFYLATDLTATVRIWGGESANRFTKWSITKAVKHFFAFPLEIVNCTLPWSGLLLCFLDRDLRERLGPAKNPVRFLAVACLLCIFPLMLAHAARGRYFMPLYPCIALLCGAAAQTALSLSWQSTARRIWRTAIWASLGIPLVVTTYVVWQSTPLANWIPKLRNPPAAQSWPIVLGIVFGGAAMAWFCRRAIVDRDTRRPYRAATHAMWASAVFYAFGFTCFGVNSLDAYSYDHTQADVRRAMSKLPPDAKLVSFAFANHLFTYHLAGVDPRRVELLDAPTPANVVGTDWEYFCYNVTPDDLLPFPLPFAWEQVDVVTVDRNRYDRPRNFVVIARKLPSTAQTAGEVDGPAHVSPAAKPMRLEARGPIEKRS